jgi:hypothetical protein
MSNIKISQLTQNDSKSSISELTNSDLAGIQGGKGGQGQDFGRYNYYKWLAASFGYNGPINW